ncbi:MAG TPA: hypothetical protein HPP58_00205 [Deltaproteobacteria bacterium]|nr:hypothetical protein [Deltaproteobacteria bacterium]HIJ35659.1 hypothetical protein [Deltaproteobacteria bacterium]HIJ39466.1 hypothetical protein [Deltaproteobacteria bacterium]
MEKDFRYKMRHIGDAFADQVEKLGHTAKGSVRGVVLTYNIDGLKKEKEKIVVRVGERMAAGRKDDPTFNISEDEIMTTLLSKLDQIEEKIEAFKRERKERLYPKKCETPESAEAS